MKKQILLAVLGLTASQLFAYKKTGEEAKDEAPEYTYLVPTARDQALFKATEQKMSPAEREERERQWQEFLKKSAANK